MAFASGCMIGAPIAIQAITAAKNDVTSHQPRLPPTSFLCGETAR